MAVEDTIGKIGWSLLLVIWFVPALGWAGEDGTDSDDSNSDEQEVVELNEEQFELYNRALDLLDEEPPETSEAIRLLESALIAGREANLLYLTLGRAQQLAEECEDALETFEEVEVAPLVAQVPKEQVLARLHNYRSEIESECDGTLFVECRDPETELATDDVDELVCNEPMAVEPGHYEIEATLQEVSTMASVDVVGGRRGQAYIDLDLEERRRINARNVATEFVDDSVGYADDEHYRESVRLEIEAERGREITEEELIEELPEDRRPVPEEPSLEAGYVATQLSASPVFGGYAVQAGDGFADGGILYGATGHLYGGFGITDSIAVDLRLGGAYLDSHALGFKDDGFDDGGTIHWTATRLEAQAQAWLEVFGLGGFVEYRRHILEYEDGATPSRAAVIAGPALTLSQTNILRDDRYLLFQARWGLLGDGDIDVVTVRMEHGVGYAVIGAEFGTLVSIDDNVGDAGFLRGGEFGMLTLGFRIAQLF